MNPDWSHPLQFPFCSAPLGAGETVRRRAEVAGRVMQDSRQLRNPDFAAVEKQDLYSLLHAYDELFLDGGLNRWLESRAGRLQLRWSRRMTSSGGITSHRVTRRGQPDEFEIAISSTLLFGTDFGDRPVRVAGVVTDHRLDALQRIFEHELVHLLEMILWGRSSCARARFRRAVAGMFGHRESNHQLITPAERIRTRQSLDVGDPVRFRHRGRELAGYINRVGHRVTVLVEHPSGHRFDDGRRYLVYYVPPRQLRAATG